MISLECDTAFNTLHSCTKGEAPAGERCPAEDNLCWWKGRGHHGQRAGSNGGVEGASELLWSQSCSGYFSNWQGAVFLCGAWKPDVDGRHHGPNRMGWTSVRHVSVYFHSLIHNRRSIMFKFLCCDGEKPYVLLLFTAIISDCSVLYCICLELTTNIHQIQWYDRCFTNILIQWRCENMHFI